MISAQLRMLKAVGTSLATSAVRQTWRMPKEDEQLCLGPWLGASAHSISKSLACYVMYAIVSEPSKSTATKQMWLSVPVFALGMHEKPRTSLRSRAQAGGCSNRVLGRYCLCTISLSREICRNMVNKSTTTRFPGQIRAQRRVDDSFFAKSGDVLETRDTISETINILSTSSTQHVYPRCVPSNEVARPN